MVTKEGLSRGLALLGLTRYCPRFDLETSAALIAELKRLGTNDAELAELIAAAIEASDGEWPGLGGIYTAERKLRSERELKADRAEARKKRDEHEAACPGYVVNVDGSARLCSLGWEIDIHVGEGSGWGKETVAECRVASRLTEEPKAFLARVEAEELAKRFR